MKFPFGYKVPTITQDLSLYRAVQKRRSRRGLLARYDAWLLDRVQKKIERFQGRVV